jgi:hypothetical protein
MKNYNFMSNDQTEAAVLNEIAVSQMYRCLGLSIAGGGLILFVWVLIRATEALNAGLLGFFGLS